MPYRHWFKPSSFTVNIMFFLCFILMVYHSGGHTLQCKNDPILPKKNDSVVKYSPLRIRGYFNLLGNDLGDEVTAPLKMEKKQLLHLGLFACATAALIVADPNIDNYARRLDTSSRFVRNISPQITNFGATWGFYTVGALEVAGLIFKDKKLITTGLLASQAMFTSGLITRFGKILFSRARPSASFGSESFKDGGIWSGANGFIKSWTDKKKMPGSSFDAFPSGHTSMAFSIATVYARMYKDKPAIPVIAYTMATLVGLSRLTQHAHWGSDVFVGAALGYLCGRQVVGNYQLLNKVAPSIHKKKISLSLNYEQNTYFAGVSCVF